MRRPESENDVWWGPVNVPMDEESYFINRERAKDYLNTCERLYVVDGYAGWDTAHRLKIRVICSRPYHALFMHTMLIRLTPDEPRHLEKPDFRDLQRRVQFPPNRLTKGMSSTTSIDLSLEDGEVVILGTEYAGGAKKASSRSCIISRRKRGPPFDARVRHGGPALTDRSSIILWRFRAPAKPPCPRIPSAA